SPQGASQGTQQALAEGAEIILGPLFAVSVPSTAQLTRTRGVSVIAFSTDSSIAGRGVYLLSFLPESDVNRIIDYAAGTGKRSFAALLPDNAYGNVVEAAFKQAVARKGGRIVAFEKYGADRSAAARTVAQSLGQADALLIADDGESVVATADALTAAGSNLRNIQLLRTGLWDNPRVFASPVLQGGLYAAPDPSGFRSFAARYRTKFGGEPVRTATLAYDAVALVAALSRTQGAQRFAAETLTNPSGFAGIDGLFRFRADGTNERGLAVMKVAQGGGTPVVGSPKSFGASFSKLRCELGLITPPVAPVDVGEQRRLLTPGDVVVGILTSLRLDPGGVLGDGTGAVAAQSANLEFEHVALDLGIAIVPAGRPLTVLQRKASDPALGQVHLVLGL